jgi:DNA-binding HxlR family transcriptional regulator
MEPTTQTGKVVALKKPKSDTGFKTEECKRDAKLEHAEVIENALRVIGGKWKVVIIFHLAQNDVVRFGELKRKIMGVTQRILTNQLREMEADGLILRKVYPEVPPKVEYSLSDVGRELKAVYTEMFKWGSKNSKLLARVQKAHEAQAKASQA